MVQGTRRHRRGLGSQKEALVDQASRGAERFIVPGHGTLPTAKDRRGRVDRKKTRERAKASEGTLFVTVE